MPESAQRSTSAMLDRLTRFPGPGWRRYAVAVAATAVMVALRVPLSAMVGERLPFITFFLAVFVSAWYGGLGPALLATGLGGLASFFVFLPSLGQPGLDRVALVGIGLFTLTGLATAWLGETRMRALRLAASAATQATAEAQRADEERARAEDEAAKAEEAAAEAETAAQDAADALEAQLEAEAALRRSEQELSDFFENATVGLNWVGADGAILRANRAQLAMLGWSAGEYVGRPITDFHVEPAVADGMLQRLARGEEVREVASQMRCRDGGVRDVVISSSAYFDGGRFVHSRCFVRDVTEQKRAEEAVRALQRLETVGRLAGGMAHEVNNQMTVVLGAADFILRRDDVPQAVQSDVHFIRDAAQRSAGITAQLLAFGRRQMLRPEVLDLHAVLADFEPVLRRSMGGAYDVALIPDGRVSSVRVDRGQLEQVLLNLALNAADAMPDGGTLALGLRPVRLAAHDRRLPLEPDVHAGEYAELTVRDTGSGMDAKTLERIFEPFFTTKGVGKGTGLGLSTVYGIVRQSGGHIAVSSTPGQGTVFTIYLPVTAELAPQAPATEGRPPRASGETVLVVEDTPEVRQMTARQLRDAGYEVREAGDGVEALSMLAADGAPVHLVLTDLALPRMDGVTLARELATIRPGLPVLLMTGYTSSESARTAALQRGHALIEKPFTAEALARQVREALDAASSAPARA